MDKLCPLSFVKEDPSCAHTRTTSEPMRCKQSECAWYDEKYRRCALMSLACKNSR